MTLIENWHKKILKLWSARLSLLLAAVAGLYSIWGAFQAVLPLWLFALLACLMSVLVVGARIVKQPGIE
jgi:hypothetical protein